MTDIQRPSFSVVIPTFNREKEVLRAIDSVLRQSYDGPLEIIVVNDGSTDETLKVLQVLEQSDERVQFISFPENRGRIAARNAGTLLAENDWIVWLDSDDELYSSYLEIVAAAIEKNVGSRLFTCGAAVYNDKSPSFHVRDVFAPEAGEKFKSGRIGTGSFIFKRADFWKLEESKHPYGGPDSFSGLTQQKYPEIAALYGKNDAGSYHPLGNPWGDDWVEFFLLTRQTKPIAIPLPLYIQHVRNS